MRSWAISWLTPVGFLALEGCGDCGCGGCFEASGVFAPSVPVAFVLREADGATVVEVQFQTFGGRCMPGITVSRFFRWNPMTLRAEPTVQGHQPGARTLVASTQGGGTDTYEDVAPGLTIRVAQDFSMHRLTVTFNTPSTSQNPQTVTCSGQGGSLACTS
jgi:hypothetical protein